MPDVTAPREHSSTRAYGVAIRDHRILLVRAAPHLEAPGMWWLPGGGIDFGETPMEALDREVQEETGLRMTSARLFDVMSDIRTRRNGDRVHTIRIVYRIEVDGGELRHETNGSSDLAHWFAFSELDGLDLSEYARRVIEAVQTK